MSDPDAPSDDRTHEAAVHLQKAALEFIEAARLLLDLAEEAVREPGNVVAVVSDTLGSLAAATGMRVQPRGGDKTGDPADGADPGAVRRPRVEHIRIS